MERSRNTRMMKMAAGPVRPATSSLPGNSTPSTANMIPETHDETDSLTQEFSVRVPDVSHKQHNLMRFNGALGVDFAKWNSVKLQREDNSALHKAHEFTQIEMPKFGAGSEYGREQREEARRRKYGMNRKKYKPEDQPWILKESNKKYKGLREGGVNENASYFIFTQAPNGYFEVFPIKQWFNFTTIARYKSLTAEEAEEQFSKRHKVVNHFSIMFQKRLRDDEGALGGEGSSAAEKKSKQGNRDMLISDMDDWVDDDGIGDEDSEEETSGNKKKKNAPTKTKKKKADSDENPSEDSDDGDEEGRERDYTSDSSVPSEDEDEKKPEMSGVDQEGALKSLLDSDSSSEDEKEKEVKEEETNEEQGAKKKKSKKNKKKNKEKKEEDEPDASAADHVLDELGEDSTDIKIKTDASAEAVQDPPKLPAKQINAKVAGIPTKLLVKEDGNNKRKISFDAGSTGPGNSKKLKAEVPLSTLQLAATEGITEDAVRKYLLRKPMTIAELLQKFKPKKSKISSNDLVPVIAHILKKLNPTKRTVQNKMYFFLNKTS